MNAAELATAQRVLGEMADTAASFRDQGAHTGDMAIYLRVAYLYLAEYAGHLARGLTPNMALLETVRPAPLPPRNPTA